MNISTTRLLDFKPSLMKSVDKDGKVCPTANSYQLHHPPPACKPHQGSRTINPLSHPRIARYAMLVTPLGFLKSSYWNNPKGTWFLETLNGLILFPTGSQQAACMPLQPGPVTWAQSSCTVVITPTPSEGGYISPKVVISELGAYFSPI